MLGWDLLWVMTTKILYCSQFLFRIFPKMKVFMPLVFALLTSHDAFAVKEVAQFGGCLNTTLLAEGMSRGSITFMGYFLVTRVIIYE